MRASRLFGKTLRQAPAEAEMASHRYLLRAGFDPASHDGKALLHILETYPRDDLFQIDTTLLSSFCEQINELSDRPRDLSGIGLLFNTAPGIVSDRPCFPEHPRRRLDLEDRPERERVLERRHRLRDLAVVHQALVQPAGAPAAGRLIRILCPISALHPPGRAAQQHRGYHGQDAAGRDFARYRHRRQHRSR